MSVWTALWLGLVCAPSAEAEPPLVPPELAEFAEAEYPAAAAERGVQASVLLSIDIDAQGTVEAVTSVGVEPAEAAGLGFEDAAVAAARRFRFTPARLGEEAVPVQIQYRYNFVLRATEPEAAPPPQPEPVLNFSGAILERGTREPLAGLVVVVSRKGDGGAVQAFEAVTDAQGRFAFYDLDVGAWDVAIEPAGYYAVRTSEDIVAGERTEVTYYAERRSYNPYDVLVTAERPRKEVNRTTIEAKQADKVPGTFGDALAVVQNLPGVARALPGSGFLIVRGSAPEDSQIFVDGVVVPLVYHFGGLRSVVPVGMLSRLDFYPGNFATEYGRATGGILDVGTATLNPTGVHGYIDVSLLDTGVFLEVPLSETLAVAVAGRRSYIDFILNAAVPDDASVGLVTAPRYYDYQVLVTYRPAPAHSVRAFLFGADDRLELLFRNPAEADVRLRATEFGASTTFYRALLDYTFTPDTQLKNSLRLSVGPDWFTFQAGDTFIFDFDLLQAQLRDQLEWHVDDRLTLRGGVDYLFIDFVGDIRLPLPPKEGERPGQPDLNTILFSRPEDQFHSLGLFASADYRLTPPVLVSAGVRVDYFSRVEAMSVDPRLTLRWDVAPRWVAKAAVGLFHQEPLFDETDVVFGNPDLGLESAVHYALGAEYRPAETLSLDCTLFYKDLDDLVSRTDASVERNGERVPQRYNNGGEGRVYGAELLVRRELSAGFFGWISYTLSRAQRRDSGDTAYRLFDFDQTHILAAVASYQLPRNWEIGVRWRYVSGRLDTPVVGAVLDSDADQYEAITGAPNSVRTGPFHQLDVRIDKRWVFESWMLTAYIDLQNAYNRANPEGRTYNYDYSRVQVQQGLPILPILGLRGEM